MMRLHGRREFFCPEFEEFRGVGLGGGKLKIPRPQAMRVRTSLRALVKSGGCEKPLRCPQKEIPENSRSNGMAAMLPPKRKGPARAGPWCCCLAVRLPLWRWACWPSSP